MIVQIGETEKRKQYLNFTKAYFDFPQVVATRTDISYISGTKDILNKKIGVVSGYAIIQKLKLKYPEFHLIELENVTEGLKMVLSGELDGMLDFLPSISWEISQLAVSNLKISGQIDEKVFLGAATRNDEPLLHSIIQKAVLSITPEERKEMLDKWISVKFEKGIDYTLLWKVIVLGLFIILAVILWARFIQSQKLKIEQSEKRLNSIIETATDGIIVIDKLGHIQLFSHAAETIFGYTVNEVYGRNINILMPEPYHSEHDQYLRKHLNARKLKIKKTQQDISGIRKNGNIFPMEISISKTNIGGEQYYTGIVRDITERKNAHDLLVKQQLEIQEIHKHTQESIEYAALIQSALIPEHHIFTKYFKDSFAIWHPKDIVGGDIYLVEEINDNEVIIMVIDCTGHGVPGAFVTMLVKAVERQIAAVLHQEKNISPAKILSIFNSNIKNLLQQEDIDSISNAGFDGGILYYNKKEKIVRFSGAETPLFIIQNDVLKTIKGDRHSIGYKKSDANYEFVDHTIDVRLPSQIYLTTDGFLDQNGGKKGFPLGKKRFIQMILENTNETFADQQEVLLYELQKYQKDNERNDDVTVIGIKI